MRLSEFKRAIVKAVLDVDRHHLLAFSGNLAYYFFMSLFPLLIFLASALAYIPLPHLFDQIMIMLSYVVPSDSMILVKKVLGDIMATRNTGFLSIGILGTIWAASGGFSAMIEALNVAYDVREGRPFWKTRSLAIGLTFMIGALSLAMLTTMTMGPRLGGWVADKIHLDPVFIATWFYFRWVLTACFAILGVEVLYYLAPNVEQRNFLKTIPGAVIAVALWVAASYALGLYLQHFAQLSKSYGSLGAVAGLMLWFYISSAAILIGAELNAELIKAARERLPVKEPAPKKEAPGLAA